jgi:nicotinamide-nucleotide amidase
MKAEIISIGDELLIGQVINSNQAEIAAALNSVGVFADRMSTVGDSMQDILDAFARALETHDVVTVTGGLGPTHDDITRQAVCTFFDTDLIRDEQTLAHVRLLFSRRNLKILTRNEDQALVPRGCTVIHNLHGTAPGFLFERSGKAFFVMPGVPFEMRGMIENFILPYFRKRNPGQVIFHRTILTTGIAESFLAEKIGNVETMLGSSATLAFLPSPMGVRLRISVKHADATHASAEIVRIESLLRERIEKFVYGVDEEILESVVGRLLTQSNQTIAVAESCTGGLITDRLTNVPGSSSYLERGIVAYSNGSKIQMLGVAPEILETHGAVSREVAEAMAHGVRRISKTDIGLSTTGIAGPSGGSTEKPVGLVWIGYADRKNSFALRFHFGNDRRRVKERASQAALELVRRKLAGLGLEET